MTLRKRSCPAVSQICQEASSVRAGRGNPPAGDVPAAPSPPTLTPGVFFSSSMAGNCSPPPKAHLQLHLHTIHSHHFVLQKRRRARLSAQSAPWRGAGCAPAPRLLPPSQRDEAKLPVGAGCWSLIATNPGPAGELRCCMVPTGTSQSSTPSCQGGKGQNQALTETGQ